MRLQNICYFSCSHFFPFSDKVLFLFVISMENLETPELKTHQNYGRECKIKIRTESGVKMARDGGNVAGV